MVGDVIEEETKEQPSHETQQHPNTSPQAPQAVPEKVEISSDAQAAAGLNATTSDGEDKSSSVEAHALADEVEQKEERIPTVIESKETSNHDQGTPASGNDSVS